MIPSHPLTLSDSAKDYAPLLDAIGDAHIVCIGDGSHGTKEFYKERAQISQLLIQEKGFRLVTVEADWPDSLAIHHYIQSPQSSYKSGSDALNEFTRFPKWMWKNQTVLEFIEWCKEYNTRNDSYPIGFFGLDMYSLARSSDALVSYLSQSPNKTAFESAKCMHECFDRFNEDPVFYAFSIKSGLDKGCREYVIQLLRDLRHLQNTTTTTTSASRSASTTSTTKTHQDENFYAEMNAWVVKDAEEYYRCMLDESTNTWNIRDTHMVDTLGRLMDHYTKLESQIPKVIVWAHNSHIGDASYTEMGTRKGEVNIGQLCRSKFSALGVYNMGFLSHTGTVTAAHEWDGHAQLMHVLPSRSDSFEYILHKEIGAKNSALILFYSMVKDSENGYKKIPKSNELIQMFAEVRLERFIGVIYRPDTERWSHYSEASLSHQFDAIVFIDETNGVEPLKLSLKEE